MTWTTLRGHQVLQLGSADYVLSPVAPKDQWAPVLLSINGDTTNEMIPSLPFGVRWALNMVDVERGQGGTAADAIAIAAFRKAGLLPESAEEAHYNEQDRLAIAAGCRNYSEDPMDEVCGEFAPPCRCTYCCPPEHGAL